MTGTDILYLHLIFQIVLTWALYVLYKRQRTTFKGLEYWVAGYGVSILGFIIILLQSRIPMPTLIAFVLPTPLFILGTHWQLNGFSLFFNKPKKKNLWIWIPFLSSILFFTYIVPSVSARTTTLSIGFILFYMRIFHVVYMPGGETHLLRSGSLLFIIAQLFHILLMWPAHALHAALFIHIPVYSMIPVIASLLGILINCIGIYDLVNSSLLKIESEQADELRRAKVLLEQTLEDRTTALLDSERAAISGILSAGISHDMLNILSTVTMATKVLSLSDNNTSMQNSEVCEDIQDNVVRLEKLCHDLTSITAPAPQMNIARIELKDLIHSVVALLSYQIRSGTKNFTVGEVKDGIYFKGDFFKLEQLLINLIRNSLQALENNTQNIDLQAVKEGDAVIITLSNEGKVIPAADLERIKDPYYSTKNDSARRGLGLFMANRIAELHRGKLSINTSGENRTVATLSLPI